jgi:hypothetical protein
MESEVLKFFKGIKKKKRGPDGCCLAAARGYRRAVAVVSTWSTCDPPRGGRGGSTSCLIHDAADSRSRGADGRGGPNRRPRGPPSTASQADASFIYIMRMAKPSASLLLFPLPWQERLGVAYGWF